ncbi:MAG: outer membrane lipoprotein carrier protein LolA [Rariglobus sp.]
MKTTFLRLAFVLLLASTFLRADPAPLDPAALPPSWETRVKALLAPATLSADFVETREVALKNRPVSVKGVVRISRQHGLSLQYDQRRAPIVIVDERGMLARHPDGKEQTPPPEAEAGVRLLHALLSFDLVALGRSYEIAGEERPDGAWLLQFKRRDGAEAYYRDLVLAGEKENLSRIEFRRDARQNTIIRIGETRLNPGFTPEELALYFR